VYILLLAPRAAGKARGTSIPAAVCKERATQPAGLRAAARSFEFRNFDRFVNFVATKRT